MFPGRAGTVDSQQITREQAKQLHDAIAPTLGYLSRLIERMEKRRFPRTDPLFKNAFVCSSRKTLLA